MQFPQTDALHNSFCSGEIILANPNGFTTPTKWSYAKSIDEYGPSLRNILHESSIPACHHVAKPTKNRNGPVEPALVPDISRIAVNHYQSSVDPVIVVLH